MIFAVGFSIYLVGAIIGLCATAYVAGRTGDKLDDIPTMFFLLAAVFWWALIPGILVVRGVQLSYKFGVRRRNALLLGKPDPITYRE